MKLCFNHDVIIKRTGGYDSSINRKVEYPHHTIKEMVYIQLLSCGHNYELWCFCYQYTLCIIYHLIKRRLGTAPIFCLGKTQAHLLHHLLCRNSHLGVQNLHHQLQARKNELGPCTNTYPRTCPPEI